LKCYLISSETAKNGAILSFIVFLSDFINASSKFLKKGKAAALISYSFIAIIFLYFNSFYIFD